MDDIELKKLIQAIQERIIRELFSDEGRVRASRFDCIRQLMPELIVLRRFDKSFEEISVLFKLEEVDFPADEIERYFLNHKENVPFYLESCTKADGIEEVVQHVREAQALL